MPAIGDVIAQKYRLERILGRGGYGVVFAAKHLQLDHLVAIKFLTGADPQTRKRFLREAKAAVRLESEFAAKVVDVGESDAPDMFMEYLHGATLSHVLDEKGPLVVHDAVEYVIQAAHALAEAHGHGFVHRDVKPENLFLTHDRSGAPRVKVLDFGITKV